MTKISYTQRHDYLNKVKGEKKTPKVFKTFGVWEHYKEYKQMKIIYI